MKKPLLIAKKLSKFYQMGEITVKALQNASFELMEGELVVILGPSGSGKSTLLNLIGGMDQPTSGELYYRASPLHLASSKELTNYRRNEVGFIFQFYNLMPNLTAYENVNLSVQIAKNPLPPFQLLEDVGLKDRANHFPAQLSGGEQQRVALARALAKNPQLLLCDEPTGALDLKTSIHVLKLLKNTASSYGKTVVIITHNTAISQMANQIFHIKDGRIDQIQVNLDPISPEQVNW